MAQRRLFLFGTPRLATDGAVTPISRRKVMALLAYLAVTGRRHGRDALVTLLWPDEEPPRARAYFRRTLSLANRTLGGDGVLADRESVGLHPDLDLWVDVAAFQQRISVLGAHGHPVSELCSDCVGPLEEAVELYADDFLAGFTLGDSAAFDEWQFFQSEALRDGAAGALALLSAWYGDRAEEETDKALTYGRRWLALDPLHESAHRQLMRLYAKLGQRSAALRQYRLCVRTLEQELGVAPSAETSALYEGIRATGPDPAGAEASLVASPVPRPTTLPLPAFLDDTERPVVAERPVFVGREPELARLAGNLDNALAGRGQVAFVVGGPGRGKSSLVRAFAERAMAAHPDLLVVSGACNAYSGVGDAYLPFREALGMLTGDIESRWRAGRVSREHARRLWSALPVTLPALVAHGPHVIDSFVSSAGVISRAEHSGLGEADWMAELRTLCDRSAGGGLEQQALFQQVTNTLQAVAVARPLLLVLDDLQWMDQGSIGLLFHLGRRLAGCRILLLGAYRPEEVAAGRLSNGVSAPHPLTKTLNEFRRDFGDVWIDLRQADESEGRQFVDALVATEDNRLGDSFRVALYERTGGHPLFTIELMRAMQARGDLVLDAGGAWVEGESLDWTTLPARVEAVIEERLGRLSAQQRDLLAVASVEGETFTVEILGQVEDLTMRSVLRTLRRDLAGRHRLVREVEGVPANGGSLSRFEFVHALYQEHLHGELTTGERRLIHGEVAAALEHLYGSASDRVAVQLAHHYNAAGITEKAIDYAVVAGDQARESYATDEAKRYYERALEMLAVVGNAEMAARRRLAALTGLGKICFHMGEIPEAESHFRAAVDQGVKMALDPQELALIFHWLGETLYWQSQYEERVRVGEEGLALLRDDAASLGVALMNQTIAFGAWPLGDWERASELTMATAEFVQDLPYVEELSWVYGHIVGICMHHKDIQAALEWTRVWEEKSTRYRDLQVLLYVGTLVWDVLELTGDLDGAIERQQQRLAQATRLGDARNQSWAVDSLARLYWMMGDLETAEEYSERSLRLAKIVGYKPCIFVGHCKIGWVALCRGNWQEALRSFRRAEPIYQGEYTGVVPYLMGRAHLMSGDRDRARKCFETALLDVAARPGDIDPLSRLFPSLGGLDAAYDDPLAFQAWVQRFRADMPRFDAYLKQWCLVSSRVRSPEDPPLFCDDFSIPSPKWRWEDLFGDCDFAFASGLTIYARNGRYLRHANFSAPRLMRELPDAKGDIIIEATCEPALADRPGIGGLLLWQDKRNYLWLQLGRFGVWDIALGGCLDNQDVVIGRGRLSYQRQPKGEPGQSVVLRLVLVGDQVEAYCSADAEAWFAVGQATFTATGPLQIGLHGMGLMEVDRAIHNGAYPDGTAIRFGSFRLWAT